MRDHAHTLSDFRVPTLSIECEPCGRRGRYNVAKLMQQHGDGFMTLMWPCSGNGSGKGAASSCPPG